MCPACYQDGGSLLHCLSTLTSTGEAVYFCCTGLGVTSTGRYPASCPAKPGLSSSEPFRLFSRDYLAWLRKCYSNTIFFTCKAILPFLLYIETASPDKFSQNGIMGHCLTWNRQKIIKEFQKPFRFCIFRLIFINSEQQRFCINLQARKFIDQRRIKHHICFFLERKNILFLSPAHRGPPGDGLLRGSSSGTCISYNPADQPCRQ